MSTRIKTLTAARTEILTGHPFNMVVCTYDTKRNTGGERLRVEGCRMVRAAEDQQEQLSRGPRDGIDLKEGKNPRHLVHNTFNVLLKNGQTLKGHWLLMEEFNGFKVVL